MTSGLLDQVIVAGGGYPYLTVNAYNPWALVPGDIGNSLANSGQWVCDGQWGVDECGAGVATFGPDPGRRRRERALLVATAVILLVAARRPDRLTILLSPGRPGPRLLRRPDPRPRALRVPVLRPRPILLAAISLALADRLRRPCPRRFLNMYVVLTTLYRQPDDRRLARDRGGLRTATGSRSSRSSTAASSCGRSPSCGAGARRSDWPGSSMTRSQRARDRGRARGRRPRAAAARPRAGCRARTRAPWRWPPTGATARPPTPRPRRRCARDWCVPRSPARCPSRCRRGRPARPSPSSGSSAGSGRASAIRRSARTGAPPLRGEGGGRLDRLDLWLLVVLVVATWSCGRSASPSPTRCTSTRSITPGPRPSSCRTGATACPTTSTSGPTRTSPSTRWPPGSSCGARTTSAHERARRPGPASVVEPRTRGPYEPDQRPGSASTSRPAPRSGPTTCATRDLISA